MNRIATLSRSATTRLELALLLITSVACVLVLTAGVSQDVFLAGQGLDTSSWLTLTVAFAGVIAAIMTALSAMRAWRRLNARRAAEILDLRRRLTTAEALIRAEPQVLIYWESGKSLELVTHTLTNVPGLPASQQELLRFGLWLDVKSAAELKSALDGLFGEGRSFNIILRTIAGGHVEADGRTAGSRAILRLRDVAGYKRDLGLILDHQKKIGRDVRASRALLDALPSPAWLRDSDGRLSWVNTAYVQAVEAKNRNEVIDQQIELLESRQRRSIQRAHKAGRIYRQRLSLIVRGDHHPHNVIAVPVSDASAGVAIDIAALESARGELDRQVLAYDRTLDRVATAVAIFNADRRLTFHNQAYRRLWNLEEEWLRTAPEDGAILERLRDEGRLPGVPNWREWKNRLLDCYAGTPEIEDWWHLPDGRVLHVTIERRPDGGVTYLFDDCTERLALESKYVALTRVQGETLNSLSEGVAVFGTDGRLKLFNTAFAKIWHMSARSLGQMPHIEEFVTLARVLYPDAATWQQIVEAVTAISAGRDTIEGQMQRPDQSVIDYAVIPLPDGATLITFSDVTDARRYERALVERNEALVAAGRLKSQFIGHVSYELRTPLTNIIGFSELLCDPNIGELNSRQRDYLDHITMSSKSLLAIIDDILDLATIDAGALELHFSQVDPRDVIDATILALRERAVSADLTIEVAIADDVRPFEADHSRVRQILYNLMSNAVGFSPRAGVVRLECWREDDVVVFRVIDQGIGIPVEQQARVFERFESRSQGSNHRGAGLGLSIVKSLVDLHGGQVLLESQPGSGTLVTVRLPERANRSRTIATHEHEALPAPEHVNTLDFDRS
jgi:signal transduction histidine kinase